MRKILFFFCFSSSASLFSVLQAQNVGINTDGSSPDASAILDVKSTDRGLLVPRMNLSDVTSASPVTSPATGLLVYNTNASVTGGNGTGFYFWNGSQWVRLDAANSGAWRLTGNAGTSPSTNFLGTTDAQDLVLRTNNAERLRILSGGDVGIGTATPTHRLHVNGATRAENGFLANDGTAGVPAYRFNSDTDVGMFRPAANHIGFAMDGQEKLRINGNAADALVGINNNSPSAPLDFVRTTSNSMLVGTNYGNAPNYDLRRAQGTVAAPTIVNNNTVLARLRALGYDGSAFQTAAQIAFETDAATGSGDMPGRIVFSTAPDGSSTLAERMRISNDGIIRFNNYTANGVLVTSSSDGTIQEVAPGASGNILVSSGTAWTSGTGSGQFIQNQNASDQTANFRISGTGRANTSFQSPVYTRADAGTVAIRPNTNSTTAIQLQNAGGTSILNVDATNERVGIGTTAPGHVLHVIETSSNAAIAGIQIDETNVGQALIINEAGNGAGILINASDNGAGIFSDITGAVTAGVTGYTFYDSRTSTTASIGKVGVDIQSTGTWSGSGASNNALNVVASGGSSNVGINVTVSGGTSYAGLFNGGNVGIGTTTPNTNLDVVGGASAAETRLLTVRSNFTANNTGSAIALINSTSPSSNVGAELAAITTNASSGASQLVFRTHGGGGSFGALNERMRLTNEGRLGIGTNAPLDMLHVDNSAVGASSARIGRTAAQFDNRLFFGDGSFVYVGELNADDRLYLRGSTMSIDINGSLGGANGRVLTSNGTTVSWQPPVPIGAIIAWVNHLTGTPALPPGWVECNGGTVSDAESPINGQPIPNLNGAVTSTFGATDGGRFLRGTTGTTGGTQADRVPNFDIEQDATNSGCGNCVITADGASTAWSPYLRNYYLDDRFRIRYNGGEVRPVSYTVRWIMRIK